MDLRSPDPGRAARLDALRGLAMLWMAGFHFAYDLAHFGLIEANFARDPVWTVQRSLILGSFLACAGLGLALGLAAGQDGVRFGRRWAQVAGAALLVSVGSWLMFGPRYIHFGVLHALAVMLPLARLLHRLPALLAPLGLLILLVPTELAAPSAFDGRLLNGLGFLSRKPPTEDHVPLLPWFGVLLLGLALGRRPGLQAWLRQPLPARLAPLACLGRWSLSFYLLHQPVLIGGLMAVLALGRASGG